MVHLTDEDILFFAREGYLVKRTVLDPELMSRARERMWSNLPPPLERGKPETWIGPFPEVVNDSASHRHQFMWKYREPGGEDWMVRMLATDTSVKGMAEQMLGDVMLVESDRIRGIYCVLPEGDLPPRSLDCHVDGHPFHLGVVGYIDDCSEGGGGFTVWPGSHRVFYSDFPKRYTFEKTTSYLAHREEVSRKSPVECHGKAGDIVFWHHRIGHSVGHNRTARIRQAVLCDYKRADLDENAPPGDDMWVDWPGVSASMTSGATI